MMQELNRLNGLVQQKDLEIDDLRAKLRQADIRIEAQELLEKDIHTLKDMLEQKMKENDDLKREIT